MKPARRTIQDLIVAYRAARKARDPEEIQTASIAIGAALEKRGMVAEVEPAGDWVTLWQPVSVDGGGPPGFAMRRFKTTTAVFCPAGIGGKTGGGTTSAQTYSGRTIRGRQLQTA